MSVPSPKKSSAASEPSGGIHAESPVLRWFVLPLVVFGLPLLPLLWLIVSEHTSTYRPDLLFQGTFDRGGSVAPDALLYLSGVFFALVGGLVFGFGIRSFLLIAGGILGGATFGVWCLKLLWAASNQQVAIGDGSAVGVLFRLIHAGYSQLHEALPFTNRALGYTIGVGIAEELAKVAPILLLGLTPLTSRVRLIAAFSVGAGFGLAESLHYAEQYSGREPAIVYFVRFFSLVALHAMWTTIAYGFVTMVFTSARCRSALGFRSQWSQVGLLLLGLLPAVLTHGFYNAFVSSQVSHLAIPVLGVTVFLAAFTVYRRRESLAVDSFLKPGPGAAA